MPCDRAVGGAGGGRKRCVRSRTLRGWGGRFARHALGWRFGVVLRGLPGPGGFAVEAHTGGWCRLVQGSESRIAGLLAPVRRPVGRLWAGRYGAGVGTGTDRNARAMRWAAMTCSGVSCASISARACAPCGWPVVAARLK